MTRFLNISTDNTLGGLSPSDEFVASQKAIKEYVDNNSSNVQIDDLTITQNANDDIQAVGTINKNTAVGAQNPVYDWVGTYQEWVNQDVATSHPEWVCFITDDSTGGELKANTNLDNLTEDGKNISTWSTNVSNCITEIPQDINLTLSAGTLTLKAGSKVYVPNGFEQDGTTKKFDVVTVAADKTFTNTTNGQYLVLYNSLNSSIVSGTLAQVSSGTPDSSTWGFFYDTDANRIDFYNPAGTRNDRFFALPLCIVTVSNGAISSIDQVFNGFGFVGGVVFALPGVKVVQPNGRNADGTLKNNIRTIDAVKTGNTYAGTWFYGLSTQNIGVAYYTRYFEQETMPSVNCTWYKPSANQIYHVYNGVASLSYEVKIFYATRASGIYTSLTPYMPFRAVDYSDTDFIAHQAMPSDKKLNLTVGVTGTQYTANSDGYFTFSVTPTASNLPCNSTVVIKSSSGTEKYRKVNTVYGLSASVYYIAPVSKGDIFKLEGLDYGTWQTVEFVYANGVK